MGEVEVLKSPELSNNQSSEPILSNNQPLVEEVKIGDEPKNIENGWGP